MTFKETLGIFGTTSKKRGSNIVCSFAPDGDECPREGGIIPLLLGRERDGRNILPYECTDSFGLVPPLTSSYSTYRSVFFLVLESSPVLIMRAS